MPINRSELEQTLQKLIDSGYRFTRPLEVREGYLSAPYFYTVIAK